MKRYRYTGKERDKETGFSYHGARYDVPWLAVWVSCDAGSFDPLRQILTSSYAAFALSPVQYDDPDGASPEKPPRSKAPSGWERFKDKARRALFILGTILKDDPNPIPPPAEPGGGLERQKKKQADADQEERAREKNKSKAAGSSPPPNGPEPEPPGGSRSSSGGSSGQADHITEQQLGGRTASKTNRPG